MGGGGGESPPETSTPSTPSNPPSPSQDAHRFAGLIRTALLELEELGELGGELE